MDTNQTMPAGTYYIGDLCYVMHPEWDEFCDLTIKGRKCLDGVFTLKDGRQFATFQTMYGDGEYECSNGALICVDAGLIGCILESDIHDKDARKDLGTIVEFSEPFKVGSKDGTIRFGNIKVETDC